MKIVDLPIRVVVFHGFLYVYQRVQYLGTIQQFPDKDKWFVKFVKG